MAQWPFGNERGFGPGEWSAGRALSALGRLLEDEFDRWFLWVPVCFGAGIGLYFSLAEEPSALAIAAWLCLAATLCLLGRSAPLAWLAGAACLIAVLGFADAKIRTASVSHPVQFRHDGVRILHGWVEKTESRLPRGYRLTLRVFAGPDARRRRLPERVRVTSQIGEPPGTGTAVHLRARLRSIPEPVMPGGFDFSRKAFYNRLDAVGFALSRAEPLADAPSPPLGISLRAAVDGVRHGVERRIASALPGDAGAIAMALITGERGRIPEETLLALRHSGLAHMLAISGMHMALMAGSLYWLLRAFAAALPRLALRYPVKKWAAMLALLGGAFYLALSGGAIATQRAFLMMGIVFTAILLDRPAITLRNVALSACVILALFPESLLDVSFQMSFAAVTGLVAVYERVGGRRAPGRAQSLSGRLLAKAGWYLGGIALTTLVASVAVAPFAAFHFHKLAQYGLLANMATMPLFGLLVMPSALVALMAMPLGLESVPLQVMAWGIDHIVGIAKTVSSWSGATVSIAAMPLASLLALVGGGLWLCLWRRPWRLAGLALASLGLLHAGSLPKPDLLIGRDGALLAVRTDANTLAVTGGTRPSYSLERWLEADGDARDPVSALRSERFSCDELACIATVKGQTVAFVLHPAAVEEECASADIVISQVPLARDCPKARVKVDRRDLWRDGAHALYFDGQSIRIETVAEYRGNRPWSREPARRHTSPREGGGAFAGDAGTPR